MTHERITKMAEDYTDEFASIWTNSDEPMFPLSEVKQELVCAIETCALAERKAVIAEHNEAFINLRTHIKMLEERLQEMHVKYADLSDRYYNKEQES